MHRSHLPLKTWFMAVHIVTSHSNGPATPGARARQLQECLAPAAQAAPCHRSGSALEDLIEIDEANKVSPQGKMRTVGIARGRATPHPAGADRGFLRAQPRAFVAGTSAPGARVINGWSYCGLPDHKAQGRRCNARPSRADVDPSCVLEPEALGARNLPWPRRAHLRRYLDRSCSVAAATPQRLSTPCSDRHAPATRRLPRHRRTTRLIAGRAPATARPPIRSEPNTGPPACLQHSKPTSSRDRHGPRAWNVEARQHLV